MQTDGVKGRREARNPGDQRSGRRLFRDARHRRFADLSSHPFRPLLFWKERLVLMWRGLQPAASRLVSMPGALKSSPQERRDESRRRRLKPEQALIGYVIFN